MRLQTPPPRNPPPMPDPRVYIYEPTMRPDYRPEVSRRLADAGRRAGLDLRTLAGGEPTPAETLHSLLRGSRYLMLLARGPRFRLPRSRVLRQPLTNKRAELLRMQEAGLPVPRWAILGPGELPDLSTFGPFVVTKPLSGSAGALVRVMKKSKAAERLTRDLKPGEPTHWIIQDYIHTGPVPTSWRVGTLLGRVFFYYGMHPSREHPFPEAPTSVAGFTGRCITANSRDATQFADTPEAVLELARRTARAFPEVPMLGIDIIPDTQGGFHVLECNLPGWCCKAFSPGYAKILAARAERGGPVEPPEDLFAGAIRRWVDGGWPEPDIPRWKPLAIEPIEKWERRRNRGARSMRPGGPVLEGEKIT